MGITVRELTFGGRGRVEHAPYPQMWYLTTAIPRDPVQQIKQAVAAVPGVAGQHITVTGYIAAEKLTQHINKET